MICIAIPSRGRPEYVESLTMSALSTASDPKNVTLSSGCTSIMVTDAIPYVESGQLKVILAGMPGAAEYEQMVYDFMVNEQINNNSFINPQGNIVKGKAYARMSAQSVAHLLMVLFIVIGNCS